ncbi:MAG: aminomethyl transferase family protein [Nonomuraea sp.]|nr:aminomethyl transferase family protein [Nonomuraea sp.]
MPAEFAVTVYETLMRTGRLTRAGHHAIEAMRIEKGYRAWGARHALETPSRKVVSIVLDDPAAHLWGGESLLAEGVPVGHVTSAAHSPTLGRAVALGLVAATAPDKVEVDVAGDLYSAQISPKAPYDPTSARVKS